MFATRRRASGAVLLVVLVVLVAGGCRTLVRESMDAGWIEIPPGSRLTLHRPVEIPPGRARAFLVDRSRPAWNRDGTSCALEVRRIDPDAPQIVAPGSKVITHVQNLVALVSNEGREPNPERDVRLRLASHGDSGGAQMIRQGFHFRLEDDADPNLMRMTCLGRLDEPASTRPPTLDEIRDLLGGVATLSLASDGTP